MNRSIRHLLSLATASAVITVGAPGVLSPTGAYATTAAGKASLSEDTAHRTRAALPRAFMLTNVQTGKCLTIAGGVQHQQQRHRPPIQLRYPSLPPLDTDRRNRHRPLPNTKRTDPEVPDHRRRSEHRQQRHRPPVQLRQSPLPPLDTDRRNRHRPLPNTKCTDPEVPDHRRRSEHRQQRHRPPIQLRYPSLPPLDAETGGIDARIREERIGEAARPTAAVHRPSLPLTHRSAGRPVAGLMVTPVRAVGGAAAVTVDNGERRHTRQRTPGATRLRSGGRCRTPCESPYRSAEKSHRSR